MMKLLELIVLDLCTLVQLSIQMDRESPKKEKPQVLEHNPAKRQLCYMLTFQPRIEVSASRLV